MNIAIIDADLIGRAKHRFPNLACMKISGYYKELGHNVILKTNYSNLESYDKVFISKVFTDTEIDKSILNLSNVEYGGTGFFYDKAPKLSDEIEHHMPDYNLYDDWVNEKLKNGAKRIDFKCYLDYSIGFMTRGCFRQCAFCVNKNYTRVSKHSPLNEFLDESRKSICLLDDNFLGCPQWKEMLLELQSTGKPFHFKQGLDERILTDEKCEILFKSRYDGDFLFAFDDIEERKIIEEKAHMIRKYDKRRQKQRFYVLCAFDRNDKYDLDFWIKDIRDLFERIFILAKYNFKPYITRYEAYKNSPFYGTYVNIARWCNQPSFFYKFTYRDYCLRNNQDRKSGLSSTWKYFLELESATKECDKYFDVLPESVVVDYSKW